MRKNSSDKTRIVPITDEMLNKLLDLKEATGYGFHALYTYGAKKTSHEVFQRTTYSLPYSWIKGYVKTANFDDYNEIIQTYESIPENSIGKQIGVIEVSESLHLELKQFIDQPRQLPLKKLLAYSDAPKGLTSVLIGRIANKKIKATKPEYIDFLERLVRS